MFAALLNQRLNGTGWTAELLANFLYNGPPEDRPPGMPPYDWRNVYNTTTQAAKLLSNFLGVCNSFVSSFIEGVAAREPGFQPTHAPEKTKKTGRLTFQDFQNRIFFGAYFSLSCPVCYLSDSLDITHVTSVLGGLRDLLKCLNNRLSEKMS